MIPQTTRTVCEAAATASPVVVHSSLIKFIHELSSSLKL